MDGIFVKGFCRNLSLFSLEHSWYQASCRLISLQQCSTHNNPRQTRHLSLSVERRRNQSSAFQSMDYRTWCEYIIGTNEHFAQGKFLLKSLEHFQHREKQAKQLCWKRNNANVFHFPNYFEQFFNLCLVGMIFFQLIQFN